MPRLDPEAAASLDRQGVVAWLPPPPLPPGDYVGTLVGVRVCTSQHHRGCSWDWIFDVEGRKLSYYTKLWRYPEGQESWWLWRLKQVFAALGVSAETETDELLGKSARLRVSQREDDYLHDLVNRIDRVMPLSTNT